MKRWRNLLLGVVFSAVFLWIALHDLDWQGIGSILSTAQWGYTLLAMGIWTLGLAARAIRWQILMGGAVKLWATFHILNIGFVINNTLPFRVGELARAYLIGRTDTHISGWAALSTIVAERILDMLMIVLILAAVLPVLAIETTVVTAGLLLGGVAVIGFIVLLIFAHRRRWAHNILNLVLRVLPFLGRFELRSLLDRILDGLQPLTTRQGLLGAILWTGISWFFSLAGSWVLAMVFPDLPQTPVMRAALTLSVVAASFSIIIPFTLASIGPFEAATRFALMTAGVSLEVAVAYAAVWHTAVVLTYAVMGAYGMLALGLSPGQIQEGASSLGSTQKPSDLRR